MRILVIETLYLGDLIHTLPLLQAVRARYPQARIEVLVRASNRALMECVAGIDEVLVMDPREHRGLSGMRVLAGTLRARAYDLVLNPGASDRASFLTALSGGRRRLGRLNRRQSRWLWARLHDQVIDQPWDAEPTYWQKLLAFREPLSLDPQVRFGLDFSAVDLAGIRLPSRYLHLSPLASEDIRCLPPSTLVELTERLRQRCPDLGLVISSGGSARELDRLALLRGPLEALGAVCLFGQLNLLQLGRVIQGAAVHLGPDSGPLHCAVALSRPVIACFLYKDSSAEWLPVGPSSRSFGVYQRLKGGLYGLPVAAMVDAAAELTAD